MGPGPGDTYTTPLPLPGVRYTNAAKRLAGRAWWCMVKCSSSAVFTAMHLWLCGSNRVHVWRTCIRRVRWRYPAEPPPLCGHGYRHSLHVALRRAMLPDACAALAAHRTSQLDEEAASDVTEGHRVPRDARSRNQVQTLALLAPHLLMHGMVGRQVPSPTIRIHEVRIHEVQRSSVGRGDAAAEVMRRFAGQTACSWRRVLGLSCAWSLAHETLQGAPLAYTIAY